MTAGFVPFDAIWTLVISAVESAGAVPEQAGPVYLVRNLRGQVRVAVSEEVESDAGCREALDRLATHLRQVLGAHGTPDGGGVLFVSPSLLANAGDTAREVRGGVYLVERLVTGRDWWTVRDAEASSKARRCTLFSVKGGVGRSTTAAVLAWHLAASGQRVLVVDLDLESPGLSSAMLDPGTCPRFGITDWFVEDLVGQGEHVIGDMTAAPAWAQDLEGEVRVVPAHGRDPGEYLAKLGRVYTDTRGSWSARLECLLSRLEADHRPTAIIMESRSGLHDIAAATVTDLNAHVLLFATDTDSTWTDYEILFRHWERYGLATQIRDRLSVVSALTPEMDTARYLRGFRERSWDLFRTVYDDVPPAGDASDRFSFDLHDDQAPHHPVPILWNRGLAAGASLRNLPNEEPAVAQAYGRFLMQFETVVGVGGGRDAQ